MKCSICIKRLFTLILFANIFMFNSSSQTNRLEVTKLTAHSPNVSSLGKYGEYTVNTATGVPQISIPLYTVKSAKLELPISISYHAAGVKIDEESSFIGLGWTLNAGGTVTRVVKDRPDEDFYGFLTKYNSLPDYTSIANPETEPGMIGNSQQLRIEYESWDKQPDLFILNAATLNSNFCLDNTGNYVSLDFEPLKYSVNHTTNTIVVKDKFGNTYRFGKSLTNAEAFETTNTTPGNPYPVNSAWHLTEIISSDNTDTISFSYQTLFYSNNAVINTDRYIIHDGNLPVIDFRGRVHEGINYSTRSTSIANVRIIDKITFKNGYLQFFYVNDRIDVTMSSGLQKARIAGFNVFDKNNVLVQKIQFRNDDNFDRTAAGSPIIYSNTIPDYNKKSLKLNGVEFFDKQDVFTFDYKFQYDPAALPPRNTTPQDLWGFYNGKNNSSLIPTTFFTLQPNNPTMPVFIGDDRSTDFNFMKAGVLNKITYPTGGYTTYEYEANHYLTAEQQQNKIQTNKAVSSYAVNRLPSCPSDYYGGAGPSKVFEFTVSEDLGTTNQAVATLSFLFSDYQNYNGMPMIAKFMSVTTGGVNYQFEHPAVDRFNIKSVQQNFVITEGQTYRIELYTNAVTGSVNSTCNSPYIEAYVNYQYWEVADIGSIVPKQAGGLRIKSMSNYSSENNLVLKKIYEYGRTQYGPNQIGVGTLITDPSKNFYNYPALYAIQNGCGPDVLKNVIHFSSNSQIELGFNHGCPVDYELVTEKVISTTNNTPNGKTEYYFSRTGALYEPNSSFKYPYTFLYFPSWKGNQLLKTVHYKLKADNTYEPVKSVENTYNEAPVNKIKILKIVDYQPDNYLVTYPNNCGAQYWYDNPQRFFYYNFFVSVGRNKKVKEIEKDYVNGITSLVVERSFEYNNNFDLKKVSSKNSSDVLTETVYKYTGDIDYNDMKANNMISYPILRESLINGKVRGGEIIKYNDYGGQTDFFSFTSISTVIPVSYTLKESLPGYFERKQTLSYNSLSRRIKETKLENSYNTVYLWSYLNQFPIAEITSADYSTVESILGTSQIAAFESRNPTMQEVNSFLAPLKLDSRLSQSLIKSYSYDPLIGLTSETNPNGRITYYEYDALNRLIIIRDHNRNVIKKYCYNYKGQPENCAVNTTPQWNATGNYRCVLDGSGQNTGYQEKEEKDRNPSSVTYDQFRWVSNGYNASACPPLNNCNYYNCSFEGYKCVYGQCEQGYRVNTYSYYDYSMGQYVCVYHYEFSDGSWSNDYYEYSYWAGCYQQ